MYAHLALAGLFLLACVFGPPIVRGGRVARNNPFRVLLPSDAVTIEQGQSPEGRKAQEVVDWVHRWAVALVISLPVWMLPHTIEAQLFAAVLVFAATLWSEVFEVHFELVGHGAEILVAEREDRTYRHAEILRMQARDSTFRGWKATRIYDELRSREWLSKLLLAVVRL